jgi:hypothetical protein
MGVDVKLKNVVVNGDWIEGDIEIKVEEFGFNLDKTQHFKTKKNEEQTIDLGSGIQLVVKGTLKPPNQACISGSVGRPPFMFQLGERCVVI